MKKKLTLNDKAILAFRKAVRRVREKHRKSGRPMAIWKDGRIQKIYIK